MPLRRKPLQMVAISYYPTGNQAEREPSLVRQEARVQLVVAEFGNLNKRHGKPSQTQEWRLRTIGL